MKLYGTFREFLNMYRPPLSSVIIRTSDAYYFGESERVIEHLLDNQMYASPELTENGNWYVYVQD